MKGRIATGMVAAWLWVIMPVSASTVVEMSFQDVVDSAELVFEGEVLSVESRQTGPRRIHTIVRFRVLDVIKGDHPGDELELRYLGGEVNGRRMQVTDMEWPEAGESGVYFVESLQRPLVHPLVGWSQGHYRLAADGQGEDRVYTADRQPVAGHAVSDGGLNLMQLGGPPAAVPAGEFKRRVRDLVDGGGPAREAIP
ncbi:MAG: hypothetical protein WEB57_12905 [Pseudohongiellaceae bacterium]